MDETKLALRPERSFEVSTSIIADSLYVVRGNDAYEFGPVESFVWGLCDGVNTYAQIASRASAEFDAPSEVITRDVLDFLGQLTDEGLLELV